MAEGSSVRWQFTTITQLGYVVNLILTLSTASLGFAVALVKDPGFSPNSCGKGFLLVSLCLLVVSAGLGVCCIINRLTDFRKTQSIAKDKEIWRLGGVLSGGQIDNQLKERRLETHNLGDRTWLIFYWQIRTFAGGILALIIVVMITYHKTLF